MPDPFDPPSGGEDDPGRGAEATEAAWEALREGLGGGAHRHGGELQCVELCPICRAADVLRASGPPELRGQLNDFQREALLTLRALIDHYIERLERAPAGEQRVEQIPID